jgi:iron-sulfur cluster repair protein YtfE (RIC family)
VGRSEIRSELEGQHGELRELLAEIEALARRFEASAGDSPVGGELAERGRVLYEKFGAHLAREQELLEPALGQGGAEGERLVQRLQNEHREQRELLKYLMGRLEQHPEPTIVIARELQNFAGFLRFEMKHEEETLFSTPVLGDAGA